MVLERVIFSGLSCFLGKYDKWFACYLNPFSQDSNPNISSSLSVSFFQSFLSSSFLLPFPFFYRQSLTVVPGQASNSPSSCLSLMNSWNNCVCVCDSGHLSCGVGKYPHEVRMEGRECWSISGWGNISDFSVHESYQVLSITHEPT